MKSCQNSFKAFGFHLSFHLSKSANFVKNFCHKSPISPFFHHPKLSASSDKQALKNFAAKNGIFLLSENKNVANFIIISSKTKSLGA